MRLRFAIRAGAVLLAMVAVTVAAAAPRPSFTVGVLRRDGVIVPFATWDGRHWRAHWPRPDRSPDVPVSLASVPSRWWGDDGPAATWEVWTDGRGPRPVHVTQPDWFEAQCLRQIGLRTDYRPSAPPPPPSVQPYPKDGIAVTGGQHVEPIDVEPASAPGRTMIEAFETSETRRLQHAVRLPAGISRDAEARARVDPTLEAEYVFGDPHATRYYYLEMSRAYHEPRDESACVGVVFGAGWLAREGDGPLRAIGFDASLVDCDRYGLAYMLPFGVVRVGGGTYWIAQWSGWDYERYEIVALTPKQAKPVLSAYGGSC